MSSTEPLLGRSYPGGKGCAGVYQKIINCMPPHQIYIEAFLGSGSVLRNKRQAQRNIGVDIDGTVIQSWRTSAVGGVELIHGDTLQILSQWPWRGDDEKRTLIYCDPPYLKSTRSSNRRIYRCDLSSAEEHLRLLELLVRLPCMVMLSGYGSPLYFSMLAEWRHVEFRTRNRAGKPTTEIVWMNFPPPFELHDYGYLGEGFRERERIKRKRDRWRARLQKMSVLERQAVLSALTEVSQLENGQDLRLSTTD